MRFRSPLTASNVAPLRWRGERHADFRRRIWFISSPPMRGAFVHYDASGEGYKSDGTVAVSVKGTITLKSVGREVVEGTGLPR